MLTNLINIFFSNHLNTNPSAFILIDRYIYYPSVDDLMLTVLSTHNYSFYSFWTETMERNWRVQPDVLHPVILYNLYHFVMSKVSDSSILQAVTNKTLPTFL